MDDDRAIVAYRWDFDEDGVWDYETADPLAQPTWSYFDAVGCGDPGVLHTAVLEVEDDLGYTAQDDESVVIEVSYSNHPPVADGDPLVDFLAEWLRFYTPVAPSWIAATLGISGERLEAVLAELGETQVVVVDELLAGAGGPVLLLPDVQRRRCHGRRPGRHPRREQGRGEGLQP